MKAIQDMQKRLSLSLEPPISRLLDRLSAGYVRAYEAASRLEDREADRHTRTRTIHTQCCLWLPHCPWASVIRFTLRPSTDGRIRSYWVLSSPS